MPEDTVTPLLLSLAITFVFCALLLKWLVLAVAGIAACAIVSAGWLWPQMNNTPATEGAP